MKLFRRKNEITLNRIHHTVIINENGEKLKLVVNADPMRLVAGLSKARKKLTELVENGREPTEDEMHEAAEYFAAVMFGKEQTQELFAFYANDNACVINVCGQVFRDQLTDKIVKAQKKMKV